MAEDVVSLVDTQLKVLQGFLTAIKLWNTRTGSVVYMDGIGFVISCLANTQRRSRLDYMVTLKDSCGAANDFLRLSEKMELLWSEVTESAPFLLAKREDADSIEARLEQQWMDYVALLSQDAAFAAERTQVFLLREIHNTTLSGDLFSLSWEDEWTHNEVVVKLLQMVDRYLNEIGCFLANDFLRHKALIMCCKAIVCFYVRCLVEKADSVSRRRRNRDRMGAAEKKPFQTPSRALLRMWDDVILIKDFFVERTSDHVVLTRIVTNEVYILELIHECLSEPDDECLENFIVVIHKRTGADSLVTRHFVGDLWLLVAGDRPRRQIDETMLSMKQDLAMVSIHMKERSIDKKAELSFVRLDEMLKAMYEDRIVQGALPLCWTCLPKVEAEGNKVVAGKIRSLTRSIKEMGWNLH